MNQCCIPRFAVLFGSLCYLTLFAFSPPLHGPELEVEQSLWEGTLDAGGQKLLMKFEFHKDQDAWKGVLHSPDEGHIEIPISKMQTTDGQMEFMAPTVGAKFAGELSSDGLLATGIWSQNGHEIDFVLRKVDSLNLPKLKEAWQGTLKAGETKFKLGLKIFQTDEGDLFAKLDSYSQGVKGIPVDFKQDGRQYLFSQAAMKLTYKAELSADGKTLSGTWEQVGTKFPLELERMSEGFEPVANRPQNPKGPFPYKVKKVTYENATDKVTLGGTLTTPNGEGPFPVAILISGSGSQDRDETLFEHKPFWVIADYLTRHGVAVLRFDDRGVGESTGVELLANSTSQDFANDVQAGIDFLKTQDNIDSTKIGLIGHSEGGLIAPMVATQGDDVNFIISLAGPGVDGGKILTSQLRAAQEASGFDPDLVDAIEELTERLVAKVNADETVTQEVLKELTDEISKDLSEKSAAGFNTQAKLLSQMMASPWARYFIKHDPAVNWKQVRCPVLVLNGEKDLQVLADLNLPAIKSALEEAGNNKFKIVRLANLNHLFQETEGPGLGNEYGLLEQTFSPNALQAMSNWLDQILP